MTEKERIAQNKYRAKNRLKVRAWALAWHYRNRETKTAYARQWYHNNKGRAQATHAAWMKNNKSKVRRTARIWWLKNRVRVLEKSNLKARLYRQANKERQREIDRRRGATPQRKLWRRQHKQTIQQVLRNRLHNRITDALKRQGHVKKLLCFDLVGMAIPELKIYIESQFKPGMTWGNRSQWHLDHKKSCSSFDLSDEVQQRACFHYTNLQPLWWWENLAKGAKNFAMEK